MEREKAVFRSVAFKVSAFDYLKNYQRHLEAAEGRQMTNNEVLARIIREHQQARNAGKL